MNRRHYYYTSIAGGCLGIILVGVFSTSFKNCLLNCFLTQFSDKQFKYSHITSTKHASMVDPERLASSVWCMERLDGSKLCNFKNLYHLPKYKGYLIFLLNEYSVISGVKSSKTFREINLSSIKNHTGLYLKLIVVKSSEYLLNESITFIDNDVLIMKRFKPDNIMHVVHDDLLPLFITLQELCKGNVQLCISSYQLLFFDDHDKGPYHDWYTIFSSYDPIFLVRYNNAVCVQKSVIGLSQESIWFQYGFKSLQGPLSNSTFSGLLLKQFSIFIKHQFGIGKDTELPKQQDPQPIVFLSRKVNRKILNENILEEKVKELYQNLYGKTINILNVDLSVNSSKSLIKTLQTTHFLIGMHGSAMILGIFLPQGSNIIELFPFGIQPEFVSPLKALCSLPNMFYNYEVWVNVNESNTRTHPEYDALHGGLTHLPMYMREKIINVKLVPAVECCHNEVYLFRMFQDTIVDESFYDIVFRVLTKKSEVVSEEEFYNGVLESLSDMWYIPSPVINLSCKCVEKMIKIKWSFPVDSTSKVKFSVATNTGVAVITELTSLNLEIEDCYREKKNSVFSQFSVSVWVKALEGHKESIDSYIQCIL